MDQMYNNYRSIFRFLNRMVFFTILSFWKEEGISMGKYDPLQKFLEAIPASISTRSFSFFEIEQIIGAKLPSSAHKHRPWWSNQNKHQNRPQAASWIDAGWNVDTVNKKEQRVVFKRYL